MNIPDAFLVQMKGLLGDETQDYLDSFEKTYGQTFRINRLKTEPADDVRRFFPMQEALKISKVPWCEEGYYYEGEERISLLPHYYAGAYYIQEPSAMAPAAFLPVKPGDRVLDLCAAPGGKSTALAGKLQREGLLVSNDISISRCQALLKNLEMAGVPNVMVTCETPEKLAEILPGFFDCILIDAPCSGEGMFRKDHTMMKEWSPDCVKKYASLQKEILHYGAKMLAPGGYLMYSTCTYSPAENEAVVAALLAEDDRFEPVPLPLYEGVEPGHPEWIPEGPETLKHCRRFFAHRVKGEGQFAALLHKKEEDPCTIAKTKGKAETFVEGIRNHSSKKKKNAPDEQLMEGIADMQDFLATVAIDIDYNRVINIDERVFLLPQDMPALHGVRVVRSGLYLGDIKKRRFEPSQALAMALSVDQYPHVLRLSSDDPRIEHYLKCETIGLEETDEVACRKGWILVCVEDLPLGWGKLAGTNMKNKYAPGWRKQ